MRFAELEFSVEYIFVRAPPSGGGSNAPRPAVSVPHIDVNADGCQARRARSCKKPHVEDEFRRFWLNLNVCNAWMICKFGIVSKRYLLMFGILRWHVQLIIVWSQIVHQAFNCTRLDDLQNWHHFQMVLDNVSANTTYYCLVTDCAPLCAV